jgi:transcriptional regulator with XRE-family HTH domain
VHNLETINSRIFEVRSHFNLSQKEFSEKINISFRNLQNYETGKTENIPHTFLYAISETFGVDMNWLFFGKDAMFYQSLPISEKMKSSLAEALRYDNAEDDVIDLLHTYILRSALHKLEEIKRSYGQSKFWNHIYLTNRFQDFSYPRLLTRALLEAKQNILKSGCEIITIRNAKETLKKVITNYKLRIVKDKINNLIDESTKKELLIWIDNELDDTECMIILSDFDKSIEAIKMTLNSVEQKSVKLD